MKFTFFRLLFCATLAFGMAAGAWAQMPAGQIKAARIEGEVTKLLADGTSVPLKNGDLLTETDTVITAARSSVVLVFANASTVKVSPESKLKIDTFKMDPLAEGTNLAALTEEPSPSETDLNLEYGEIVGDVKKLKGASTYNIKTPVGAAGIRGTIYRIVFRPTGTGNAFNFQVTTAEGLVVFEGTTGPVAGGVQVAEGTEIVVTVDVPTDGTPPTISQPVAATTVPDAALTVIKDTAAQVTQVLQEVTFTPTPPPPAPTPPPEQPKEEPKEEPKQEPPPPTPPPTQTQPTLTNNAGG